MKLGKFLILKEKKISDMANQMQLSKASIYKILKLEVKKPHVLQSRYLVSCETLDKLFLLTDGMVTPEDYLGNLGRGMDSLTLMQWLEKNKKATKVFYCPDFYAFKTQFKLRSGDVTRICSKKKEN